MRRCHGVAMKQGGSDVTGSRDSSPLLTLPVFFIIIPSLPFSFGSLEISTGSDTPISSPTNKQIVVPMTEL